MTAERSYRLRTPEALLFRGKVVHPDGSAHDRYLLVRNGRIEAVSRSRPPASQDARLIETGGNDWIFPGLIDLHSHTDYNILPLWSSPKVPFKNRHEWRRDAGYKKEVRGVYKSITTAKNKRVIALFAELQAVTGGTTTLQESYDLDKEMGEPTGRLLVRGTDDPTDLGLRKDDRILSVVDLFRPSPSKPRKPEPTRSLEDYQKYRAKGHLFAMIAHLAEGRTGFGGVSETDPYSRMEFQALMTHPYFKKPKRTRRPRIALVHGSGIDTEDPEHIDFLLKWHMGVIWSPVSNLLLYGDTLDVETLIANGIPVAIGSDWSPSGSKHVWEEAKFARFYFEAIGTKVSDAQVFQMVTTEAARCLGVDHLGSIRPGSFADFFILRSPLESDNPLEVFFRTDDRDVRAVIVGGRPLYGAKDFLELFDLDLQPLPAREGSAVVDKVVYVPSELGISVEEGINTLEDILKEQGIKRSNLLASSDRPYQERIVKLKRCVLKYGVQVQQWKKRRRQA